MHYFPERLKMARIMKGWSMQDLSDQMDNSISKQAIGKYEKGDILPEKGNLITLSNVLEVKLDFFDRPSDIDLVPSFRKLKKLPKKKQDEIIARTKDYLDRYREAESLTLNESTFTNPLTGICNSLDDAERMAQEFREYIEIKNNPIHNVVELLEELGVKVFRESFGTSDLSGISSLIGEKEAVIVINMDRNIDGQRFTALHELGHLVLNIPESVDGTFEESWCNRFAGAMLIPKTQLIKELGSRRTDVKIKELEIIKEQYGISPLATLYRAKDLEIISPYHFTQKMKLFKRMGWFKKNIGTWAGNEESNRLLQILCMGISEDTITSSKAADLYGQKLVDFRDTVKPNIN